MGRHLRVASVSGDMRHKALPHGAGTRVNRDVAGGGGRQARRGRRRDREGERAYDPTEGRSLTRRLTERRSLRPPRRAECARRPSYEFALISCGPRVAQNALFRHITARETRDQTPASLRGTMENGPTGQTRSSNRPPGCGGVAPGTRRPQPGARPHGKAQSVFWFNKNCAVPFCSKQLDRTHCRTPAWRRATGPTPWSACWARPRRSLGRRARPACACRSATASSLGPTSPRPRTRTRCPCAVPVRLSVCLIRAIPALLDPRHTL